MAGNNEENNNNIVGKVLAGAAVIGAGVAAAKVLSDENNRKKIEEGLKDAKEKGGEFVENLKQTIADASAAFEKLRAQIENSQQAKDFKAQVEFISNGLKEIQDSNQDDVNNLVAKIQEQIDQLRKDFETKVNEDKE